MGLLDRLGEIARAVMTTDVELRHVRDSLNDVRQEVRRLADDISDMRERLIRLEASRDADRSHLEAALARFKTEAERAELRLTRLLPPSSGPCALPGVEPEE